MGNNGQTGTIELKNRGYYVRFRMSDGARKSIYICPESGPGAMDKAAREKRKLEIIESAGVNGNLSQEFVETGITFKAAANAWMNRIQTRSRNPIKPATAKGYSSYLNGHLLPELGNIPLAQVNNKQVRFLVEKLKAKGLSAKMIVEIVAVVKLVVASVTDDNGEPLYARKWNHDFIDLPVVKQSKQNRASFSPEQVQAIIEKASGRYRVLFALLAGTGLRIGEALAIELGPASDEATTLSKDCKTLYVRKSVWNGQKQEPKTQNAVRDIDICSPLAAILKDYIGDRDNGYLFASDSGRPLLQRNISRDGLEKILFGQELQNSKGKVVESIKGVLGDHHKNGGYGFHSFRRFRVTHLRANATPEDILRFWTGHADKTITDRYSQMKQRIDLRKEQAEKAGLGFDIPAMELEKEELEACSK